MPESSADKIVAHLRALFQATGVLHEVQVQNLKLWPRVAFPMVASSTASVNVETREVVIELVPKLTRWWLPKDAVARCEGLHKSIQYLLGLDFETEFLWRGKAIFRGRRIEPVRAPQYEGTDFEAGRVVPEVPWNFQKTTKKV